MRTNDSSSLDAAYDRINQELITVQHALEFIDHECERYAIEFSVTELFAVWCDTVREFANVIEPIHEVQFYVDEEGNVDAVWMDNIDDAASVIPFE